MWVHGSLGKEEYPTEGRGRWLIFFICHPYPPLNSARSIRPWQVIPSSKVARSFLPNTIRLYIKWFLVYSFQFLVQLQSSIQYPVNSNSSLFFLTSTLTFIPSQTLPGFPNSGRSHQVSPSPSPSSFITHPSHPASCYCYCLFHFIIHYSVFDIRYFLCQLKTAFC